MADESVRVRHNTEKARFEVLVDDVVAGFAQYVERDDRRIFFHTEVSEEFSGRGLAKRLVPEALEHTVSDGKSIVPVCPLVKSYVAKNHDFDEHIARPDEADLAAIKRR